MTESYQVNDSSGTPASVVLNRHRLAHVQELKVDRRLFEVRFQAPCSMANCSASCCRYGVFVDLAERERILAHIDQIIAHMYPHQEKNPREWFEPKMHDDPDFPSGKKVGTRAMSYGCVFLNRAGRCTLQETAVAEGLDRFFLKLFHCVAYPISIEDGVLIVEEEEFLNCPQCCRPTPGGSLTIFDVCGDELRFVLGPEGEQELREMTGPVAGGLPPLIGPLRG